MSNRHLLRNTGDPMFKEVIRGNNLEGCFTLKASICTHCMYARKMYELQMKRCSLVRLLAL